MHIARPCLGTTLSVWIKLLSTSTSTITFVAASVMRSPNHGIWKPSISNVKHVTAANVSPASLPGTCRPPLIPFGGKFSQGAKLSIFHGLAQLKIYVCTYTYKAVWTTNIFRLLFGLICKNPLSLVHYNDIGVLHLMRPLHDVQLQAWMNVDEVITFFFVSAHRYPIPSQSVSVSVEGVKNS